MRANSDIHTSIQQCLLARVLRFRAIAAYEQIVLIQVIILRSPEIATKWETRDYTQMLHCLECNSLECNSLECNSFECSSLGSGATE
ncbi:MAG: hypothetical protein NW220_14680 [Leptolyngbyaceae cyanobacterium bins.349]|nr:hypothetical protein [Leptolyngbyaceae cyanobacterium bins.349]